MVKLAVSICLSAVSAGDAEIIRLCAVAVEAVDRGLLEEWARQKGSAALLTRVKEKAEGELEGDMLEAVRKNFEERELTLVFYVFECVERRCLWGVRDGRTDEAGHLEVIAWKWRMVRRIY